MISTNPQLHTLANGMRVLTFPFEGTETVTALILVKVGSRSESSRIQGISHFLEHLLFKGTKRRPSPLAIAKEIDAVGGYFNAYTTKDHTGFYMTSAVKHLDLLLDILSDALTNSLFDENELKRERGVILEEMRMYFDAPSDYIDEVFEALLYGDHPLGRDIVGTFDSVKGISRSDVLGYVNNHYVAENIVVCLAGKLNGGTPKKVKEYFGKFQKGNGANFEQIKDEQNKPAVRIKQKDTDQAHIALGVRTFSIHDERREALELLATVLGGEKSSRMFTEVRDKRGLAYYVYTDSTFYNDVGHLATFAGANIEQVDVAIQTILNEYKRVAEHGIANQELKDLKSHVKGRLLIELESSFRMARMIATNEVLLNKHESLQEHFNRVDAVTASDIKQVAKDVLLEKNLNLAVIGPFSDKERFAKLLKF
jgi:predicted Zn-dependent peptidase